jgi:hypothetical protein
MIVDMSIKVTISDELDVRMSVSGKNIPLIPQIFKYS